MKWTVDSEIDVTHIEYLTIYGTSLIFAIHFQIIHISVVDDCRNWNVKDYVKRVKDWIHICTPFCRYEFAYSFGVWHRFQQFVCYVTRFLGKIPVLLINCIQIAKPLESMVWPGWGSNLWPPTPEMDALSLHQRGGL